MTYIDESSDLFQLERFEKSAWKKMKTEKEKFCIYIGVASSGSRNIKLQTGYLFVFTCWFINDYELLLKVTLLMSTCHTQ